MKAIQHICCMLLMLVLAGCTKEDDKERWAVTLDQKSKEPYGTWLSSQSLKYFFPASKIETLPQGFRLSNMDDAMRYNSTGANLIVLTGLDFYTTEDEWEQLKRFARSGNEVLVFCSHLDRKIEEDLNCYKRLGNEEMPLHYLAKAEPDNKHVLALADSPQRKYGYEGRSIQGYFSQKKVSIPPAEEAETIPDTSGVNEASDPSAEETAAATYPEEDAAGETSDEDSAGYEYDVLGYARNEANFIRFKVGEGHITMHAAPLVMSNYFLLQPGNKDYLTGIWQSLPDNINHIYWIDYYKRTSETSDMEVLWRYPATRLAMQLGIFALLIYVLFESKRRQRIVPIIAPVKNESVSFTETVGRLYYNTGNHANLAEKMIQQYLEWVRNKHLMNTNILNDTFIQQLAMRTGQPENTVRSLVSMIHEVRMRSVTIDEPYLYQLYFTIQQFYQNPTKDGNNRNTFAAQRGNTPTL